MECSNDDDVDDDGDKEKAAASDDNVRIGSALLSSWAILYAYTCTHIHACMLYANAMGAHALAVRSMPTAALRLFCRVGACGWHGTAQTQSNGGVRI